MHLLRQEKVHVLFFYSHFLTNGTFGNICPNLLLHDIVFCCVFQVSFWLCYLAAPAKTLKYT